MFSRRFFHISLSILITAALLVAVFSETGLDGLGEILANINIPFLFIYLSLSIASLLMRAIRYLIVVKTSLPDLDTISLRPMLVVTAIRNALVDFLPARLGELSYLYVLNRYGVSLAAGVTSFGVCFALDIVVLIVLILLLLLASISGGSAGLSLLSELTATQIVLTFSVIGMLFLIGCVVLARLDVAARWAVVVLDKLLSVVGFSDDGEKVGWQTKLREFCNELVIDCEKLRASNSYLSLVLLTLGLRAAKYGSLYVLLLAVLGHWNIGSNEIGMFESTIGFLAAEAGASLPVSGLMSFGAYEGAWALVFGLACGEICKELPRATIALAVHLVTQVVGYGIGIMAGIVFAIDLLKQEKLP